MLEALKKVFNIQFFTPLPVNNGSTDMSRSERAIDRLTGVSMSGSGAWKNGVDDVWAIGSGPAVEVHTWDNELDIALSH